MILRKKDFFGKFFSRPVFAVWILTFLGSLLLTGLPLAAPLLRKEAPFAASLIAAVFAPFCHQLPSRCFMISGFPAAVCGRCLGIYAGFAAGCAGYPRVRGFSAISFPSISTLAFFSLPVFLDFAGEHIFILWKSPLGLRFGSGFILGLILPYFFIPGIAEAVRDFRIRRSSSTGKVCPS